MIQIDPEADGDYSVMLWHPDGPAPPPVDDTKDEQIYQPVYSPPNSDDYSGYGTVVQPNPYQQPDPYQPNPYQQPHQHPHQQANHQPNQPAMHAFEVYQDSHGRYFVVYPNGHTEQADYSDPRVWQNAHRIWTAVEQGGITMSEFHSGFRPGMTRGVRFAKPLKQRVKLKVPDEFMGRGI